MFKKENHNVPKDYDKMVNNESKNTVKNPVIITGDSKTKKASHSKIGVNKKIAIIFLIIIVLIVVIGIGTSMYVFKEETYVDPKDAEYAALNENALENSVNIKQDLTSQPLAEEADINDKSIYYSSALWLKIKDRNEQAVADYYIKTVKPQRVVLSLDLQEATLNSLLATGNDKEAKELVLSIISIYEASEVPDDAAANSYINDKINTYKQLEAKL